ncbi:MAG: hypothetical protein QOG96_325 [Pseudonocardiales bacterium]|nr:hypothetical protein [Pseudonocardiales bacterium]
MAATAASASAASVAACSPGAGPAATGAAAAPTGACSAPGNTSFGPLKQINAGVLNIGYAEAGPANGAPVILLHGWPYDIHSYVDVAPMLASSGYRSIVPYLRGYGTTRLLSNETARNGQQSAIALDIIALMDALKIEKAILGGYDWGARAADVIAALWPERWKIASPKWNFDDATFDRTAASFNNPDHVGIVIHNYRWRLSLVKGDPQYQSLEQKLSGGPVITVPTITISSDFDGVASDGAAYRQKFSGQYSHQVLKDIGHNVPQEAPEAFAKAIVEVDGYR